MNISLYVATNMMVQFPSDPVYKPIFCGESSINAPTGYLTDATGDNISFKNKLYCELTALYWAWKNDRSSDYIGLCHYRRYFEFIASSGLLGHDLNASTSTVYLPAYLADCDIILTSKSYFNISAYNHYAKCHREEDLKTCIKVIDELYPEYLDAFWEVFNGQWLYICQMFITSKQIFHDYMTWLFDILNETEKRIYLPYDDANGRRALGFLGERLLSVYVIHHKLKVKELPMLFINNWKYDKSSASARTSKEILLNIIASAGKRPFVFMGDSFNALQMHDLSLSESEYIVLNDAAGVIKAESVRSALQPNAIHFIFTPLYNPIKEYLVSLGYKENVDFLNGNELIQYLKE